ncbi:MAG: nicotinate-nucleotide adenylyltransferase [Candidatus Omnitrophota bacterium]
MRRIGILGGTFNPIHLGHMHIARLAVERLGLDMLYFIPVYMPPHKRVDDFAGPGDRVAMVRAAIRKNRKFRICLFEVKQKKKSYSIETLKYFRKRFGSGARIHFIIGTDSLEGMDSWKGVDDAMRLADFAAFRRPGSACVKNNRNIRIIKAPGLDISSSRIRELVRLNRPISRLVPGAVREYIEKKRLYACGPRCD